jgi:serine/threonine protein kinase
MWVSRQAGSEGHRSISPAVVLEDLRQSPAVCENYDISSLQQVGQGGMSVVFGALHQGLQVVHAIKVMTRPITDETLGAFQEEARRLAKLEHPNVIKVHQTGRTPSGRPFFIMTFVPGGQTVLDKIRSYHDAHENKVPAKEWRRDPHPLLNLITQVLRALDDVHKMDLVHRDIKPSNILVASTATTPAQAEINTEVAPRQVFLADFGLSTNATKEVGDSARRAFEGTPQYAAPEQIDPSVGEIGNTTDIYQMGLVLREALTAHAPFEGEARLDEIMRKIASASSAQDLYGDLGGDRHALPPELIAITNKALARDPLNRYQSAAAFLNDIESFQRGEKVVAYQEQLPDRQVPLYLSQLILRTGKHWINGHRATTAALAAATVLAGGGLEFQRRERAERTAAVIAGVKRKELHIRAQEALERSRDATKKGALEVAQEQVPTALLNSLEYESDPQSKSLFMALATEREHRQRLLDLRKAAVEAYLASVQSSDIRELGLFDHAKMERALRIYLPLGLTHEGLLVIKKHFSECSLANAEKVEALDILTELSMAVFFREFGGPDDLPQERRAAAIERLQLISKLASACAIKINGNLVYPTFASELLILLGATPDELLANPDDSQVRMRCDSFLQVLISIGGPNVAQKWVAPITEIGLTALENIQEPTASNIGASLVSASQHLQHTSAETASRALKAYMDALTAARKVNVEHLPLQQRVILVAGDLARRLRAESPTFKFPNGSGPNLIEAQKLSLGFIANGTNDVDLKLVEAHVILSRLMNVPPAKGAIERLLSSAEYKRQAELMQAWVELPSVERTNSEHFDRALWERVALNPQNQAEEAWLTMLLLERLGRYDDVMVLLKKHATKYPAMKDFLKHRSPTQRFSETLATKRPTELEEILKLP